MDKKISLGDGREEINKNQNCVLSLTPFEYIIYRWKTNSKSITSWMWGLATPPCENLLAIQ